MSIISKPEVTPNRIKSIFDGLLHCKDYQEEEEQLKKFLIPTVYNSISDSKNRQSQFVNPNLLECEELGLLKREAGRVKLTDKALESYFDNRLPFPLLISDFLFDAGDRNEDFLLTLAWILSLDPMAAPNKWKDDFEVEIKKAGIHQVTGMTNSNPHSNFTIWSTYLGFSWKYQGFVPDPTEHLLLRLKHNFDKGVEVPVNHFLSRLKDKAPVLDGGNYRIRVEAMVADAHHSHQLSKSLSLALLRLQDQKVIKLVKKSDTESQVLAKELGGLSFSHILIA